MSPLAGALCLATAYSHNVRIVTARRLGDPWPARNNVLRWTH